MSLRRFFRARAQSFCAVTIPLLALAPMASVAQTANPPIVQIATRGGTILSGSLQVTFYLCGDAYGYDESTLTIRLNDVDVSANFTPGLSNPPAWLTTRCVWRQQYTGTITLPAQRNYFRVMVNANAPSYAPGGDNVEYELAKPSPGIAVTTSAMYANAPPGTVTTRTFRVSNTSSAPDSITLALSCTGQAGACTMNQPASITVGAGQWSDVAVSVPMPGTAGATAYAKLVARSQTNTAVADSSWSEITGSPTPAQGVVLASSPDYQDRSLCTRVAVGGGSIQCGDLVLDHAIHRVGSMNRAWAPRLVYNSQTAVPSVTIAADITIAGSPADQVSAVWMVDGTQVATGQWNGADWGANSTRRIALNWNPTVTSIPRGGGTPVTSTMNTGLHSYTLEVSRWNGGVRTVIGTTTGETAIINRSASPFGAGWWLSGVEQLVFGSLTTMDMLWIGGDGSTRVYQRVASGVWVARNVTTPDTLIFDAATSPAAFQRRLPGGGRVDFNESGQQIAVVNRNGWGATYQYDGNGRLSRIGLPGDPSNTLRIDVAYNGSSTTLTTVGSGGVTRETTALLSGGALTSITDGDGFSEQFEGDPAQPKRIVARTDKRGTRTAYTYAPGATVSGATTPTGTGETIAVAYTDVRTRGLVVGGGNGVSQSLDSTYTRIDGPRSDVADVTAIWENELGAPVRTLDAMGSGSRLTYSTTWQGLVTEVRDAAHLVTSSNIDPASGLVTSTTTNNPFGDGRNQTVSYSWDTRWRAPTQVQNPAGDYVTMGYDGAGNRIWQQPSGDASRRVNFGYDGYGRVTSVASSGAPASTIAYDGFGNLATVTSPLGWTTTTSRDAFGRELLVTSPIDASHSTTTRSEYDTLGRIAATITTGPAMNGASADSVRVEYEYDPESNRTAANRRFLSGGLWQRLRHTWSYDGAGRMTQEIDDDGQATQFTYDPAGNVTARTNPRFTTVSSSYDPLNRLRRQLHSTVTYGQSNCALTDGSWCSYTFPTRGSSVSIVPDTAIFRYDGAGRLTAANNRYARISRSYASNGALLADELRIRRTCSIAPSPGENDCGQFVPAPQFPENWYVGGGNEQSVPVVTDDLAEVPATPGATGRRRSGIGSNDTDVRATDNGGGGGGDVLSVGQDDDFTAHVYLTRYHYDLNGRRDVLTFPDALAQGRAQSYGYNSVTGELDGVVDALGYSHTMTRDTRGRIVTMDSPGWHVGQGYDDDDNLASYNGTSITVDATGRVTYATGPSGTAVNSYDGLGRVIEALNESTDADREQFGYDALGNRIFSSRSVANPWVGDNGIRYTSTSLTGQVFAITSDLAQQATFISERTYAYDGGNASAESSRLRTESGSRYWESRSYYGADDKLRVFSKHTGISAQSDFYGAGAEHSVFEQYWYDALGRRVQMRSRHDAGCAVSIDTGCESVVTRTVWDGDQVLHEVRASGTDSTDAYTMDQDGTFVTYTHLAGIDAPVAVMKGWGSMIVPHANWRAVFDSGHAVLGGLPLIRWPGSTETLDQAPNTHPHQQWVWYGGLIEGQRDGSGQKYMRNRYYDPAKGTFTQKDPIGLAGGVNLYGYAGGDPVNFSDPFGLKPCSMNPFNWTCTWADIKENASQWWHMDDGRMGSEFSRGAQSIMNSGALSAAKGAALFGGLSARGSVSTSFGAKIEGQMGRRGWTTESVEETIANPSRTSATTDTRFLPNGTRMNDPATAYINVDGSYVVRNNRSGDVVQVSNRRDPNWKSPFDK